MKIGAILGNGNSKAVKELGQFGRTYGINSIIIEEFADMLNVEELKNRTKNEYPPLPIIYALQNPRIKTKLLPLLNADSLDESANEKIAEIVLESCEVQNLQKMLVSNATSQLIELKKVVKEKTREELKNLLLVPLTYFEV